MCLYRFSLFLYYICKARLWFYSFFFLCDCRVTYLLRLQSLMLRYGDLVEKQQDGNRMCTRKGRIFSQSSEERCYLEQNWTIHVVCRFLSVQQCPWYFPFFCFRLISKPLATGKTLQRKWWWIWPLIQTGFAGKIVEFDIAAKISSVNVQWLPVQIRTWERRILVALWKCREVGAHICLPICGPHVTRHWGCVVERGLYRTSFP